MAKPAQLPRWATDAGAPVTPEPSEGKKDSGWAPSEKPPHQYFNWWMKLVYLWIVWLDGITNEALTWAAKHTFGGGLATSVAPTTGDDVANKTYVDGAIDADVTTHNGVTNPHSATAAATADRLVLRDGAGRAKVADGSAADDIATKGQVDAGAAAASVSSPVSAGSGWTIQNTSAWKSGKVVTVDINAVASTVPGATWTSIGTLIAGLRPAQLLSRVFGTIRTAAGPTLYVCYFDIDGNGLIRAMYYDNGTSMVSPPAIAFNDQVWLTATFIVP